MKGEWEPFFEKHKDDKVSTYFYDCRGTFTVEELYQAFKERLKDELVSDTHGTSHYGLLKDRHDG